ncbi:bacterioferritin-associated ferredoxin [Jatrophihabitans endophyticus]|uniref:Bacterioferritin-associated ferredoxin n=1 Tax=Jatrophihabitans endophyticus TaxID=1206085 RepID=A0A1M5CFC6_9ACTN|nr:bacterioferritin-associated ferredoxin [Jatrophihabitans endophyticus]
MYVCICHAVTDDEIETAVDAGATTVHDVSSATAAGGTCATCHDGIEEIIEQRCGPCPLAGMRVA